MNNTVKDHFSPQDEYLIRIDRYSSELKKYSKRAGIISNLRLIVFFAGVGGAAYLYFKGYKDLIIFEALIFMAVFIYLIISHEEAINKQKFSTLLYKVNDISAKRLRSDWVLFTDNGEEFKDKEHPYSGDLDIFGRGSLFQHINTCSTFAGRHKLRGSLIKPFKDTQSIYEIQESVTELSQKLDWRQKFQAEGMTSPETNQDPTHLYKWAGESDKFFLKPWAILVTRLLPFATGLCWLLFFLTDRVIFYLPLLLLITQILFLSFRFKETSYSLGTAYKYKDSIKIFDRMLELVIKEQFQSKHIKNLKNKLFNTKKQDAHKQINKLARLVTNMVSMRYHQLYLVFDILTLWDYQCMIELEKWKAKSGRHLKDWMDTIAAMEALSSFAVIRYNNPKWAMPGIKAGSPLLTARKMGHPLLSDDIRVCSDLDMGIGGKVLLITGSNMSGKSTFLRTAGINLVLAYNGAPVCAAEFNCSIMDIYTSMRVSDNLEENISSFYAELLRIKMIVESSKKDSNLFFVLDEIFKGTNSKDRHTGAKTLIKKLSSLGAVGLVSTHDTELGELEKDGSKIRNFHFQEFYKDGEIYFDYKLRPGISTTRNAVYLMKMAGIEMDSEDI